MTRVLSTNFLRGVFAQETGICPIFLLTITHSSLSTPIRVSSDPTMRLSETASDIVYGTQSRSNDYVFFPFTLTLPGDTESGPQGMSLRLDNITRELIQIIRTITSPLDVNTEIVLSQTPDTVEVSWPDFLLSNIKYDANIIEGTLTLETMTNEPYPALSFTPGYFPGLY